MIGPENANLLGFLGVSLLLVAFFLNLTKMIPAEGRLYIALNLVGAAVSCLASWLMGFMPFVILEGTWAMVAAVALVRVLRGGRKAALWQRR